MKLDSSSVTIQILEQSSNIMQQQALPRLAIVTGANTGIGYETARALVQNHNVSVIMACRSHDKALAAAKRINGERNHDENSEPDATTPSATAIVLSSSLDLTLPQSISNFIQELLQKDYKIDILVNNAGRNTHPDNNDSTRNGLFQANFLGHYQLTAELMKHNILVFGNARIVNLSSIMHHFVGASANINSPVFWQNVIQNPTPPSPDYTYSLSKLAMILFSQQLNVRYASAGIRAVAVNPGAV
jgi:NAD(P)-dependent dehydrogenase (short-subunit alcohol dehydrogenase family)